MRLLATAVGAVLIVLIPLALGSPIDPSTPGFWDDGDFDDVIIFLTCHLHFLDIDVPPAVSIAHASLWRVVEHVVRVVPRLAYEPGGPRAPPAA